MHISPRFFLLIGGALMALAGCGADSSSDAEGASSEAELGRATSYECSETDEHGVAATLTFDRDRKVTRAVLKRVPYRGFAASETFEGSAGRKNHGRNSEQEFAYVTWDLPTREGPLEAQVSYLSKVKTGDTWKTLTLDESLLGENRATNGQPYGKLRVDVTIPDLDIEGAVGSSYLLYCKKR